MIRIDTSVVVERPVEEVFEFVANIENLPEWAGAILEAKQSSEGPVSVGTTQTQVGKFLGRRIEASLEVTEYEANNKISSKSASGPFPIEVHYTFEPVAEGTRIRMERNVGPRGFFRLAEPIVARMLKRQTETDISNLKDLLEAQA